MASSTQDVMQFLASVGSPLSDKSTNVPTKHLPSKDVLKLLDARIDALAPSSSKTTSIRDEQNLADSAPYEVISTELYHALEKYAHATAVYTHTSSVTSILTDVCRVLSHIRELQDALSSRNVENVHRILVSVQEELMSIGIHVNWFDGCIEQDSASPVADFAVLGQILLVCERISKEILTMMNNETEKIIQVVSDSSGMTVNVHPPSKLTSVLRPVMKEEQIQEVSRILLNQVFQPMLHTPRRWKILHRERCVALECLSEPVTLMHNATVPELVAVLTLTKNALGPQETTSLARHLIPSLLELFKPHLLRCIPSMQTPQDMLRLQESLKKCALGFHNALVELGYVSDQMPRSKHMNGLPEPLSDLPMWSRSLDGICRQHLLGSMVDQVRNLIMESDENCWDTELRPIHVTATDPLPLPDEKPKPAPQPKYTSASKPSPISTPAPALWKSKKPTLGSVKISAKLPPEPKSTSPKPKDEWDWGDDETEADPRDVSTREEKQNNDDWDWSDDEEEAQSENTRTSQPPPPHMPAPAPDATFDDAWDDWGEEVESEPRITLPASRPLQESKITTAMLAVSKRTLQICHVLGTQWSQLDENVPLRSFLAQAFYLSVQIFRSMMPIIHAKALENVPLLGMLHVNDCTYMSQQLRMFAADCSKWGAFRIATGHTLDAVLHTEADLLDNVGVRWRDMLLSIQLNALHECLDAADSFSRTDSDPRYEACVRCVEQIQHILTHLSSVWRQVMSEESLKKALCDLVDAVFDRALHEMEDLQDISEPESIRLAQVCRMLMDTAGAVLGGAEADVPTYFKFAYLPDILQGSLADIEYLLFDNESGSALADYSREEISMLVRALFADTPHRRRLLDRIQRRT